MTEQLEIPWIVSCLLFYTAFQVTWISIMLTRLWVLSLRGG